MLTHGQLAARTGLHVRTIRRVETSALVRPCTASTRRLAQVLGLDAAERSVPGAGSQGPRPARMSQPQLPAEVGTFVGRAWEPG
ncbi:helix-turn-helix transcriptional regulator [Nonomuraea sp. NPDC049709]|uniref:helix-turn-helix domain-containing protein n=1 Tax=Nonomuraea sp. NPDC049709 TaxID=3154736 RepID=UPI003446BD94